MGLFDVEYFQLTYYSDDIYIGKSYDEIAVFQLLSNGSLETVSEELSKF